MAAEASTNGELDTEISNSQEAHALIWNHTLSYIKTMCLKCAIDLCIPDIIHQHGKPTTISDLVSSLSIPKGKSRNLRIMMHLLSREGIFKSHINLSGEEAYDLTLVSQHLISPASHHLSSYPIALLLLNHHFVDSSLQLSHWFRKTDLATSPFEMAFGKPLWDFARTRPDFNDLFNKGMECDSMFVIDFLTHVGGESFRGVESLVDVGGGTGTVVAALVKMLPELKCTVFDLPHVVDAAQKIDGVNYVGGDMFIEVPLADVALLKLILHDWSDEECIKIMQRCKEAIPPKEKGGKVIIIDMVVGLGINNKTSLETQLLFDMEMMIMAKGKERDEGEWRELFAAAGFSNYKIVSSIGLRSLIEVYP